MRPIKKNIALFLIFFSSIYAQNVSIKIDFTSNFYSQFQPGGVWYKQFNPYNVDGIKTYVMQSVSSTFSAFGISVSQSAGTLTAYVTSGGSGEYGKADEPVGAFVNGTANCNIYCNTFFDTTQYNSEIRIARGLAGTISHELGHILNSYHLYAYTNFNPNSSDWVYSNYYPKEVGGNWPAQPASNDNYYKHIMATGPWLFDSLRASNDRVFDNHSINAISFANSGGCYVTVDMVWGIRGKTVSLLNNVTIADDAKFYIAGDGYTHNLNGKTFSGGTIYQAGSVGGLAAKVKSGSTVKGLFPTIQPAINFASSGNTIELVSTTYSESPSISSKSNITLTGQGISSTVLNNGLYISNSSNISVSNMRLNNTISTVSCQGVSISSSNIPCATMLYDYYSSQNTLSNSSSGTEDQASYAVTSYGGTGTITSNIIRRFDAGVFLTSSASYYIGTGNTFCNNGYDIYSPSPSSASAVSNNYSYALPNSVHGNVTTSGTNGVCSLPKSSAIQQTEIVSSDSKLLKEADYKYLELLRKINDDSKKEKYDKVKYENDYSKLIDDYKNVLYKETDNQIVKAALTKLNYLYKAKEDKNAFTAYLNDLSSKNNYKQYLPYIQRFSIWDNVEQSNYENSIRVADAVMKAANTDTDLTYEKGLIYKYYIKNQSKAEEMFGDLIANHPKHILAKFASQESGIEIKEQFGIKTTESEETVSYSLDNYPNPFNPSTVISYKLQAASHVTLKVYDILGREVATLVDEFQNAGKYNSQFSIHNYELSSGVYFYRLTTPTITVTKKMVLTK